MKLLSNIPKEKYNNVSYCLDYLNNNSIIGSEENNNDSNIFHCFWKGHLNELHKLCIESIFRTQKVEKIILWCHDNFEIMMSPITLKGVEIRQFNRDEFEKMNVKKSIKDGMFSRYNSLVSLPNIKGPYAADLAYASDIFRFVVLHNYGGIYFDLDILFLRDFNEIKINKWVSQWGTEWCGNACVMKLPKNHDLIETIYNKYQKPFYPTTTFILDNILDITILPSTFFDPLWRGPDAIPDDSRINFKEFDDFFETSIDLYNFFKGTFAYHWHNRWNKKAPTII